MKSFVAFAITILVVNPVFAQGIHIRENAVITPGQGKKVQDGGNVNNHTIRFELDWPTGSFHGWKVWYSGGPCPIGGSVPFGDIPYDSIGPIIVTVSPAPAGSYDFRAALVMWCIDVEPAHWSWKLQIDDSLVTSGSDGCMLQGECWANLGCSWPELVFYTPYYSTSLSGVTNLRREIRQE